MARIYFLDYLRVIAAWLVFWDHVLGVYPKKHGIDLLVPSLVHAYVSKPLGIIQDFGWFGVCLFFLISGFVITHVSQYERAGEFLLKRLFRIYPILFVAVALSIAASPQVRSELSLVSLMTNLFLVNYWIHPQIIFLGVGWTLAIEIVFYLMVLLLFPARKAPLVQVGSMMALVAVFLYFSREGGPSFFLFSATMAYIPYLIVGQILYFAVYQQSIRPGIAFLLLALAFAEIFEGIRTIHTDFLPLENSYFVNFAYAFAVFVVSSHMGKWPRPGVVIRFLADSSYAVYLFHAIVVFYCLDRLRPAFGFTSAMLMVLPLFLLFVFLVHRYCEKPMNDLARRIAAPKTGETEK